MKNQRIFPIVIASGILTVWHSAVAAELISNGGFETGFSSWTRADQAGSFGTFNLQLGTTSPVNGDAVPAPPGGVAAAMSDADGPGSHVLYQDFIVPAVAGPYSLNFSLYLNNHSDRFTLPSLTSLDFSTPAINQQARVDIMETAADPFSLVPADVLLNVYQTQVGDPLVSGYTVVSQDLTALFSSHLGQTLRLRFAQVDNLAPFQMGVDNVSISVPEASLQWPGLAALMAGLVWFRSGRRGA